MTISRITIGYPGPWAKQNHEAADHFTSKIGGIPDFPKLCFQGFPDELIICTQCGASLCLVAQIYAPLSEGTLNTEERCIYVLCCPKPKCNASPLSWKALRFQKKSDESVISGNTGEANLSVSSTSWFEDDDNSNTDADYEALSKAFSEIECAPKKIPKKGRCESGLEAQSNTQNERARAVLPCFYIHAEEERNISHSAASLPSVNIQSYEEDHENETWTQEAYEYDSALHVDRMYLKFKKHLDSNPSQCFRYSFGGKPIRAMATEMDAGECKLCGCERQFELQLMPPLIYFLQECADKSQDNITQNWNWITLLIYTCSKACFLPQNASTHGWVIVEELVIVQCD